MSAVPFYASAIVCMIVGASAVHQYYQPLADLPDLVQKRKQEILEELGKGAKKESRHDK